MKKLYLIITVFIVWAMSYTCLKQCTRHNQHKNGKHYVEYRSRGITNRMYFHSENNTYVGYLKNNMGKYVLTVVDTSSNQKYILMTDEPITITGGDINIKTK